MYLLFENKLARSEEGAGSCNQEFSVVGMTTYMEKVVALQFLNAC